MGASLTQGNPRAFISASPLAKLLVVNPLVARMFAWRAGDKRAVARVLRGTGGEPDSRSLDYYARLFQNPGHVAGALAMMARWDLDTLARDLGKLESDLLLIAGTGDLAVSADDAFQVAKGVRNARVEVLRGSGHLVHEENPEAIGNIAIGFYDDVEQRRANWH